MRENGFISDRDYALAIEAPIVVPKGAAQSAGSAVFRGPGERHAAEHISRTPISSPTPSASTPRWTCDLQRAAADAIRAGMEIVDQQIRKQRRFKGKTPPEAAGGAGRHRPAYRRGEGARRADATTA